MEYVNSPFNLLLERLMNLKFDGFPIVEGNVLKENELYLKNIGLNYFVLLHTQINKNIGLN